jgi:hypothetical protein
VVDGDLDLTCRAEAAVTKHRPHRCTPHVALAAVTVMPITHRLDDSTDHAAGTKGSIRDREPAIEVSP